jgi:integrase
MAKLDQSDVARLNDPGMYRFSRGLFLQVTNADAKSWVYRYTLEGKSRWKGVGSARDVTLAKARDRVDELRITQVAKGVDPLAEVAKPKAEVPFRLCAEQYIITREKGDDAWKNHKHRDQWRSTLDAYVYPTIGDLPASAIMASHIIEILRPIWFVKRETARRVRGRIEAILDFAADPNDTLYRNPAAIPKARLKSLLGGAKRKHVAHHPSLPFEQIGAFMVELRQREGVAAKALEFTILTAARTGETIGATWDEIDMAQKVWTVPPQRMKAGRLHRVPLSAEAIEVLKSVRSLSNGNIVFPALPADETLSDMAMLAVLKRMGRASVTVHGMRSTFRTWAEETTAFGREVAEAALAHMIEDKTEAAYQRGDLLAKRAQLMTAWGAYCDGPPAGANVLQMPARIAS